MLNRTNILFDAVGVEIPGQLLKFLNANIQFDKLPVSFGTEI
jgi:hypothetical protein